MKVVLLTSFLSLPFLANAQKLVASHQTVTYHVGEEKLFLYRTPADTASTSRFFLYPGEEVYVVGEYSPRWFIVKRQGFLYLAQAQKMAGRSAAELGAYPIDSDTHLITYQGVIEAPGVSKAVLYTRANAWVAKTYRSANDVIQMQDKDAGQLILKGLSRVTSRGANAGVVRHTLTIYVKDGRYKYVLTDFTHDASAAPNVASGGPLEQAEANLFGFGGLGSKKTWADVKSQADIDARGLVADLQKAMALKGAKDPTDF
jgi:hypothetical protein